MTLEDDRSSILQSLRLYLESYPDEESVVNRFTDFVENNANFLDRRNTSGHLTGSCLLLDRNCRRVLLTHHAKLNRWLQLGGHSEAENNLAAVALREAQEESGLPDIELLKSSILDLDIHYIPSNSKESGHFHYDVRFLLVATGSNKYALSEESNALTWVSLEQVSEYTQEASIMRMICKAKTIIQ